MMRVHLRPALAIAGLLAAWPASAQVIQPPERATRPPLGARRAARNPPTHRLVVDVSTLGGYDESQPPEEDSSEMLLPSSYTAFGNLGLRYSVGSDRRSFSASGNGYGTLMRYEGLVAPAPAATASNYGGDFQAAAATGISARTDLSASQSLQYAPYAPLGLFNGLQGIGDVQANPDGNLANALIDGRVLAASSSVSVVHQWSRRTAMTSSYTFSRRTHENPFLLDTRAHGGTVAVTQSVGRSAGIRASYSLSRGDNNQSGLRVRNVVHNMNGGFNWSRRISSTRNLAIAGGVGASRVDSRDTVRQRYWTPTAYGSISVDVGRSWTVVGDYRQSANVLPAPVFSPNTFLGRAFVVGLGGNVGSRVQLSFTGGYSRGYVPGTDLAGPPGVYEGYTTTGQAGVLLTGSLTAIVTITHYDAQLGGSAAALPGLGRLLDRSSVRAGLTWSFPLLRARLPRTADQGD